MKRKSLLLTVMAALLTFGSGTVNAQSDYVEIDVTTGAVYTGTPSEKNSVISFTNGGDCWGYDLSTISNLSTYKYIVVVPRKQYYEGDSQFYYGLSDNATYVASGATDICDWGFSYGYWQPRRRAVFNLTKMIYYYYEAAETNGSTDYKSYSAHTTPASSLKKLYIKSESANSTFDEPSAIYVTNTAPNYNNYWNSSWDACDYLRSYTTETTDTYNWGTICLPYASAVSGANVYKVVGVDNATSPTKLYLDEVKGVLKAGTPYIYKSTSYNKTYDEYKNGAKTGKTYQRYEANVTFYRVSSTSNDLPDPVTTATGLKGTFSDDTSVPETSYILKDGKWAIGTGNTVNKYKAYLTLTKDMQVPSGAAEYTTMDISNGVVTGINTVKAEKSADAAIYSMNGMKVSNPTKGMYIQNGKKFIVK